jgi:hypothetical protein
MKKLIILLVIALMSSNSAWAEKSNTAILKSMQAGDVACYVDLQNSSGQVNQSMASFEICDQRYLIGKRVNLFYQKENVLAASCNGDMDCGRSDTVWLINKMTQVKAPRRNQNQLVPSHCFKDEKIIFSCNTNSNQVISICSSASLNANYGYLQYRFGKVGSFPAYVFPMNHDIASKYFYSGQLTYSGGGGAYLKFINGTYSYVVYTGIGRGWQKQGLVIQDGRNEISRYACKDSWISQMGPNIFNQAGLNQDRSGFEIPVEYDE